MRIRLQHTVTVDMDGRLAIGHYLHKDRPATYDEILGFYQSTLEHRLHGLLDPLLREYYEAQAQKYGTLAQETND